jgi:hypothetical protein
MQIRDSAPLRASPALGEKRVADHHPDVCSHGGMLHGRHGRFVSPALTKGGAAALMLSPKRSGPVSRNQVGRATIAFLSSDRPNGSGADDPYGDQTHLRDQPVLAAEEARMRCPAGSASGLSPRLAEARAAAPPQRIRPGPRRPCDHVAAATPERRNDAGPRHRKWHSA